MRPSVVVKALTVSAICVLLTFTSGLAEDTKGKWQFGVGLSYLSTSDSIRSNADVAIASQELGEGGLPPVVYTDPRPDQNVLNEPSIRDDFKIDFSASYGLTRWLALEVMGSYLNAPVGNIEMWSANGTVTAGEGNQYNPGVSSCGPTGTSPCWKYPNAGNAPFTFRDNAFIPVGDLTEIPVLLSALVRFRPESPFDPYVGLGIGYVFTNMKVSREFKDASASLQDLNLSSICGGEVSYCAGEGDQPPGTLSATFISGAALANSFQPTALTVQVDDAFEWHAVGGVDYYFSDKMSFYVDARYSWTTGQVDIRADGFHQVQVDANDQGRLILRQQTVWNETVGIMPGDPLYGAPYYWEDQGASGNVAFHSRCPQCVGDGFFETEDKNGNGLYEEAEDNGVLYVLPPGSSDVGERLGEVFCAACAFNGDSGGKVLYPGQTTVYKNLDTEDVNYTNSMDRFLSYGLDICTTPEGAGLPTCSTAQVDASFPDRYVWPAGCLTSAPQLNSKNQEGCPAPTSLTGAITTRQTADDTPDTWTIQGGQIRFDGFSLGVGVKFTF